jgi:ATP-dependent DNA helicase RecG
VEVTPFDRDLQEVIEMENAKFFKQAREMAAQEQLDAAIETSDLEKVSEHTELADLSKEALDQYHALLMPNSEDSNGEFHRRLYHQGLLEKRNGVLLPTGSGILLFGKHPRDVLIQAGILGTIHLPDGTEKTMDFDGPMVLAPEQAIQWLRENWNHPINRGEARRHDFNRMLDELVREGLVNALVHRDYEIKEAKIQLNVRQQFLEIKSPGKPIDSITIEQLQSFKAPMLSRNPRLHAVFNIMELAEERGLGLKSMSRCAREAKLPLPRYRWEEPYLVLTIYRAEEGASAELPEDKLNELNDSERLGWPWFSKQDTCTSREYADAMEIDIRSARRHLNHFVNLGLARKTGSGSSTSYQRT